MAYAKINLGLRVGSRRDDGFHRLDGLFQSIDLSDSLTLDSGEIDSILTPAGNPVPEGMSNLAFRAAAAVREHARATRPIALTLDKSIPVAAGLGGGSADAAAALGMAGTFFATDRTALQSIAPRLGSDVPFCFRGGTARVGGRGEVVTPTEHLTGFALGLIVPPFEVATPAVFAAWDELDDPVGLTVTGADLPPALRDEERITNDLYPAAITLAPDLDEWRLELETRWSRPTMLSGSGPALFGFFVDREEAEAAMGIVPRGARLAEAVDLSPVGWAVTG
jgi:4-diphosphocytidyl-2C-methyl-D-erythritol kinase